MDEMKTGYIGDRILYYLKVKGISQKEFARSCNINETTLSKYISGEREPKYSTVMNMAYNIGVSMDELTDMDKYLISKYTKELKQSAL